LLRVATQATMKYLIFFLPRNNNHWLIFLFKAHGVLCEVRMQDFALILINSLKAGVHSTWKHFQQWKTWICFQEHKAEFIVYRPLYVGSAIRELMSCCCV
jgi:hypothetical protein